MDINSQYIGLRNYVLTILSKAKKQAIKRYNAEFDPFYKWRVGCLEGNTLRNEIEHFKYNSCISNDIRDDVDTLNEFSILVDLMKYMPHESFEDWQRIKDSLEENVRIENLNYSFSLQYNDNFIKSPDILEEGDDEDDEDEIIQNKVNFIMISIRDLLFNIDNSDWRIKKVKNDVGIYQIVMFNLHLEANIYNFLLEKAKKDISNLFIRLGYIANIELRKINNEQYLDCRLTIS